MCLGVIFIMDGLMIDTEASCRHFGVKPLIN